MTYAASARFRQRDGAPRPLVPGNSSLSIIEPLFVLLVCVIVGDLMTFRVDDTVQEATAQGIVLLPHGFHGGLVSPVFRLCTGKCLSTFIMEESIQFGIFAEVIFEVLSFMDDFCAFGYRSPRNMFSNDNHGIAAIGTILRIWS